MKKPLTLLVACMFLPVICYGATDSTGAPIPDTTVKSLTDELPKQAQKPQEAPETEDKKVSFGDYLSGRFAESRGDTDRGINFLQESLKKDPENKEMIASLYRMYVLAGRIEDAVPLARKLPGVKVVEDGSEFTPEMLLAVDEIRQGHFEQAQKYLESVPKAGFNSLLVPMLQPWLKLGEKEIKAPIEAKDIMPDSHTILPHIYLNVAFVNDISGYTQQAQEQYEMAVKDSRIEPFRAVEALVNFYGRKNLNDKRQKVVDDYLEAHGDSFLADELLAGPSEQNPKPLVTTANEGAAEVFYTMANIFHGVRTPADEIATLHLALYLRPHFPAAQFLLASAYELAEDFHDAITVYKDIDKDSPYFVRGRIRSVYDESEMNNDKENVIAKLDAIAAERPHDIDALLAKGDILRAANRYKDAITAYNEAAGRVKTFQKHHWVIYFSRGVCYEGLNQWDKAEADMNKALALDPGQPDVLNYLGYSWLLQHRNIAQAKKMIEQAYDARPEDAHIIDSMGFALYTTGDYTSAQEYYEQALERTPDDPTVNDHLGDAYWQLKRKTEARYQWERALANNPDDATKRAIQEKLNKGVAAPQHSEITQEKKAVAPSTEE